MESILESSLSSGLNILGVILAFSVLIFVHELGHYLAALLVGVRVEKFMIGFDVWGLGLRKNWRGTEYGLGLLPLGGYVKLAGQSDLPGEEECTGAPDELMSKGPAARALVFVAGVVMNLILGFAVLVAAQMYGVPKIPAVLGYINENSPAERAGLKSGDRILTVDGKEVKWFEELMQNVALSGKKALDFKIERGENGSKEIKTIRVFPEESQMRGKLLNIGAEIPLSRKIGRFIDTGDAESLKTLQEKIQIGDRIIAVNGIEIENDLVGGKINSIVQDKAGQNVTLTIEKSDGEKTSLETKVYPAMPSFYDYGVRYMRMVGEVLKGSPAEKAGLQPNDWIGAIDGILFEDPYKIISLIQQSAFHKIKITVKRGEETLNFEVKPSSMMGDSRIPSDKNNFLGLLLDESDNKTFKVKEVLSDGPCENLLKAGDVITAIADKEVSPSAGNLGKQVDLLSGKDLNVSILRNGKELEIKLRPVVDPKVGTARIGILFNSIAVYSVVEGSKADELGISRGDRSPFLRFSDDLKKTYVSWSRKDSAGEYKRTGEKEFATPAEVVRQPYENGIKGMLALQLPTHFEMDKTESFFAACSQAIPETGEKVLAIYKFLKKLIVGEVNITAAGGPIIIFKTMYMSASVGFGKLLDIAAFISINLAVLNILPLPVLDGGHLFFVLIEVLKGSPPSPKIREYAQYAGFFLLLGLMILVTSFDVYYSWIK